MESIREHTVLSKSILKTLLYFDVFQYPLTASEIFSLLPTNHVTPEHVALELVKLSESSVVYRVANFYSVQDNHSLASRRIRGNDMALKSLLIAKKQARLISRFPFVRAVMASGSLSKNYMDESSDLDFFVIAKSNRVWLTRFMLRMYQFLFLSNSRKYFCLNYFIDDNHLEIQEKNLFTATELATALPLYGKEYYQELLAANTWTKKILPNHTPRSIENVPDSKIGTVKGILEFVINSIGGRLFDHLAMKLISSHWKRSYQNKLSKEDYDVAFKAKENVSKAHPKNYQKKVLDRHQQKMEEFEKKLGVNWND